MNEYSRSFIARIAVFTSGPAAGVSHLSAGRISTLHGYPAVNLLGHFPSQLLEAAVRDRSCLPGQG